MFTSRTQAPRLQRFGSCLDPCFTPEDLKQCLVSNRVSISINELKQHLPSWHRNRACPCAYLRWSFHESKFSLLPACPVRFQGCTKPLLLTACICPLLMEYSNLCMTMLPGLLELKSSLSSPTQLCPHSTWHPNMSCLQLLILLLSPSAHSPLQAILHPQIPSLLTPKTPQPSG